MSQKAIVVTGMGKQYRLGAEQKRYQTFQEALVQIASAPFRRARSVLRDRTAFLSDERFWALRDVNFEVEPGEVVGIIGHNGAGKSTLLKILSRITRPTVGRAVVNGRLGSLLEVGTGFHPDLTGRENIYLNGIILGMKRHEVDRKFDEIVEFAGVSRFIDTQVKHYSSGMGLRLGFAVAAHMEPEILVVDEVLAVGDAEFQKKCLGKMNDVAGEGRTVLFVSHNMAAVQELCPRTIRLEDGQMVADGETSQIIADYLGNALDAESTRTWPEPDDAPGTQEVRLHHVGIRPADGSKEITMATPCELNVQLWNFVPSNNLAVTVNFITYKGEPAFTTSSLVRYQEVATGLNSFTCHIPGDLLNSGQYYVRLLLVKNAQKIIYENEGVIAFRVSPVARGPWYGRPMGGVQPLLEWGLENTLDTGNDPAQVLPRHQSTSDHE